MLGGGHLSSFAGERVKTLPLLFQVFHAASSGRFPYCSKEGVFLSLFLFLMLKDGNEVCLCVTIGLIVVLADIVVLLWKF